MQHPSN